MTFCNTWSTALTGITVIAITLADISTMMMEAKEFSDIQGYWNSKGENEIGMQLAEPLFGHNI